MRSRTAFALALVASLCRPETASAQGATYAVTGKDSFAIGAGDIRSEISYSGTQTLVMTHRGKSTRFHAHVSYMRTDGDASAHASADYVADVAPSGEMVASADRDPDYLTVLNQPFAAQLDRATLADLRRLKGTLPFDFPSPFTVSSLHGYLARLGSAPVGGRRSLGVRFEAAGPMQGALPDRPGLSLDGTITMRGTAFYDLDSALLLSLDTTVTIAGSVSNRTGKDPVTIVYTRTIKSVAPANGASAGKAP